MHYKSFRLLVFCGIVMVFFICYTFLSMVYVPNTESNTTISNLNPTKESQPIPTNDFYQQHISKEFHQQILSSQDKVIYNNPLKFDECKNAMLYRYNMNHNDIHKLIINNIPNLQSQSKFSSIEINLTRLQSEILSQHESNMIVWSQENLYALINKIVFNPYSVQYVYDVLIDNSNDSDHDQHMKKLMIYYPILKCASATIRQYLSLFKKYIIEIEKHVQQSNYKSLLSKMQTVSISELYMLKHWSYTINDDKNDKNNDDEDVVMINDCGFTFVRHPIDRFISGYLQIEQDLKIQSIVHKKNNRIRNRHNNRLKFLNVDESFVEIRFQTMIEQFLDERYKFISLSPNALKHVASQIGMRLGYFQTYNNNNIFNLNFIGKIEFLKKHFEILSTTHKQCSKYFGGLSFNSSLRQDILKGHYGNRQIKQKSTIVRLRNVIDKYYYDRLVDYYFQDFVCFGYSLDYNDWKNHNYL